MLNLKKVALRTQFPITPCATNNYDPRVAHHSWWDSRSLWSEGYQATEKPDMLKTNRHKNEGPNPIPHNAMYNNNLQRSIPGWPTIHGGTAGASGPRDIKGPRNPTCWNQEKVTSNPIVAHTFRRVLPSAARQRDTRYDPADSRNHRNARNTHNKPISRRREQRPASNTHRPHSYTNAASRRAGNSVTRCRTTSAHFLFAASTALSPRAAIIRGKMP